jgi:hypothetical protein
MKTACKIASKDALPPPKAGASLSRPVAFGFPRLSGWSVTPDLLCGSLSLNPGMPDAGDLMDDPDRPETVEGRAQISVYVRIRALTPRDDVSQLRKRIKL